MLENDHEIQEQERNKKRIKKNKKNKKRIIPINETF
jgi:hypothetical protein